MSKMLLSLSSKRAIFITIAGIAAIINQSVSPVVDTEPLIRGTCVLEEGAFDIRSQPTMTLDQAKFEARSNVSCALTGETMAHPIAYMFDDIYDQARAQHSKI